ncbi:MAG: hypothetical protein HYZ48_04690 [Chlamydiales bacterium]|nr:hypothetical protein [Chlamydiales bacterium]
MAFSSDPFGSSLSNLRDVLCGIERDIKSDSPDARYRAKQGLKSIEKQLKAIKSLDPDTLELAQRVLTLYLERTPTDQKVRSVFNVILGKSTREVAEKTSSEISETIIQNDNRRLKFVQEKIKQWRELPREQLKEDMRSFIMNACQGTAGIAPCSIQSLVLTIEKELSVSDVEIQALLDDPTLFSSYELKTGTYSGNPPDLDDCIAAKRGSREKRVKVDDRDVAETIAKMEHERSFRLKNLALVYDKVSSDPSQAVNRKYFEPTTAWYVGSVQANPHAIPFERSMQRIGAENGIVCITDSPIESLEEEDNTLILDDKVNASYPQDFVDFSSNEVRIPLMNNGRYPKVGSVFLSNFTQKTRIERDGDWSEDAR